MKATVTVTFRGASTSVVVDAYSEDISTHACECEWHFEDGTPEERDALNVTDAEEDAIVQQIAAVMYEHEGDAFESER